MTLYNFQSELSNIFHKKALIRFTLYINLLTIGERPFKKNIESLKFDTKIKKYNNLNKNKFSKKNENISKKLVFVS